MLAIIGSVLASTDTPSALPSLSSMSKLASTDVVTHYERDGSAGADKVHDYWRREHNVNVYLYINAVRVTTRPMPSEAIEEIAQAKGLPKHTTAATWELLTHQFNDKDSRFEHTVAVFRHLPLGPSRSFSHLFFAQLAAVFVTISIISASLARRLTKPLRSIQAMITQVADGNLGARVPMRVVTRADEFGALAIRLNGMVTQIERLVSERDRVLRHASHELRSPLMRLRIALDLIRRHTSARAVAANIERCDRDIACMDRLIEDLLVAARLAHEAPMVAFSSIDLERLVRERIDVASVVASLRGISLTITASTGDSAIISGNAELLARAIDNVLQNAIRFSPDGATIKTVIHKTDVGLMLSVHDTGPGVPAEHLASIFEPFFHMQSRYDANRNGHGLGLSLVRDIATLHGARVSAENVKDGFCVSIAFEGSEMEAAILTRTTL
jgi:signal transduction histidine kinase